MYIDVLVFKMCVFMIIIMYYSVCGQRLHSLNSYLQALAVYEGKGWTQAEDYIQFCLAKHSFSLHQLSEAKVALENLLSHESVQSSSLQTLYLQDYIYVHKVASEIILHLSQRQSWQ